MSVVISRQKAATCAVRAAVHSPQLVLKQSAGNVITFERHHRMFNIAHPLHPSHNSHLLQVFLSQLLARQQRDLDRYVLHLVCFTRFYKWNDVLTRICFGGDCGSLAIWKQRRDELFQGSMTPGYLNFETLLGRFYPINLVFLEMRTYKLSRG